MAQRMLQSLPASHDLIDRKVNSRGLILKQHIGMASCVRGGTGWRQQAFWLLSPKLPGLGTPPKCIVPLKFHDTELFPQRKI